MHYIYTDYLGSLRCITDASGNAEQYLVLMPGGTGVIILTDKG